ncbi:hypothetical protein L5515_018134 [Caenorhabditis briggsae]|uniref:Uncharacterized protein n=1 Tax=Caenorhabditis briggsae TaxID=6238 RepID=A0AAE9FLG9_CAEBR|nr:hypothetical protein L5515_018134 [Caenorhabditis briggsae]
MRLCVLLLLGLLLNCQLSIGLPTIQSPPSSSTDVFNSTSSELLQSSKTEPSILPENGEEEKLREKKGLQENNSDSDNATSGFGNDGILNSSTICGPISKCYVFPENCSFNCEVIYSVEKGRSHLYVRELNVGGVISIKRSSLLGYSKRVFSCFETVSLCFYGSEDSWGVLQYSFKKNSLIKAQPSDIISENTFLWAFEYPVINVGNEDKISFRIDPDRDLASGSFKDLFLKSH